jgi:hypothetical protein
VIVEPAYETSGRFSDLACELIFSEVVAKN